MSNLNNFLAGKGYGLKEVLTASGTWNWSDAGKPKKVFVRMIGGSGGNAANGVGSNGTSGGNTVWDTGAVVATTTSTGGSGALNTSRGTTTSGMPNSFSAISNSSMIEVRNLLNSHYGSPNNGSLTETSNVWGGGYGELKEFEYEPTGNVSFTIGTGGTEGNTNAGDGIQGAIELYY